MIMPENWSAPAVAVLRSSEVSRRTISKGYLMLSLLCILPYEPVLSSILVRE